MIIIILILLFTTNLNSLNNYSLKIDKCYHNEVLQLIEQQVGNKEIKPNRSIMIDRYNRSVNNTLGSPYCAAGIYYCFNTVNKELNPLLKTGLARNIYTYAKKRGIPSDSIKVGTMIIWQKGNTIHGHVETIIGINKSGWVVTVGFNTSDGNVRNGDGVYRRKRHLYNPLQSLVILGYAGFYYE